MELAFAGLDVGTSGCKLLVYDLSGRMIFKASRKYSETGEGGIRYLRMFSLFFARPGKNALYP